MDDRETTSQQTSTEASEPASSETKKRTFIETVEVAGNNLVERVKELIQEGGTSRVIIRTQDGDELLTMPLTFGVVAGGLVAWASPALAALGALAALVSRVKLEIIREAASDGSQEGQPMANQEKGQCSNWKASQDRMPPTVAPVRVIGECAFPTPGYRVDLRRKGPQGINPRILLLEYVVHEPTDVVPDVITTEQVEYTDDSNNEYDQVHIVNKDVLLDVEVYH